MRSFQTRLKRHYCYLILLLIKRRIHFFDTSLQCNNSSRSINKIYHFRNAPTFYSRGLPFSYHLTLIKTVYCLCCRKRKRQQKHIVSIILSLHNCRTTRQSIDLRRYCLVYWLHVLNCSNVINIGSIGFSFRPT